MITDLFVIVYCTDKLLILIYCASLSSSAYSLEFILSVKLSNNSTLLCIFAVQRGAMWQREKLRSFSLANFSSLAASS